MHNRIIALLAASFLLSSSPASAEVVKYAATSRSLGTTVSYDATISCVVDGQTVTQTAFVMAQRWATRGDGNASAPWASSVVYSDGPCGWYDFSGATDSWDPPVYTNVDRSTVDANLRSAVIDAKFALTNTACLMVATVAVSITAAGKVTSATVDRYSEHTQGAHVRLTSEGKFVPATATGSIVLERLNASSAGCPANVRLDIGSGYVDASIANALFSYTVITKE